MFRSVVQTYSCVMFLLCLDFSIVNVMNIFFHVYLIPILFCITGLPLSLRHKQEHINFVAASEKADIMDLAKVVIDDITELKQ